MLCDVCWGCSVYIWVTSSLFSSSIATFGGQLSWPGWEHWSWLSPDLTTQGSHAANGDLNRIDRFDRSAGQGDLLADCWRSDWVARLQLLGDAYDLATVRSPIISMHAVEPFLLILDSHFGSYLGNNTLDLCLSFSHVSLPLFLSCLTTSHRVLPLTEGSYFGSSG